MYPVDTDEAAELTQLGVIYIRNHVVFYCVQSYIWNFNATTTVGYEGHIRTVFRQRVRGMWARRFINICRISKGSQCNKYYTKYE